MKLNDLWNKYQYEIQEGGFNLIVSPVGSGKTYWIFETAIKKYDINKVLYICDTTNLKESVVGNKNYSHLCKFYDSKEICNIKNAPSFGKGLGADDKLTVMTYSYIGTLLQYNPSAFEHVECIIVDEAHNLFKFKKRFDTKENKPYETTIDLLSKKVRNNKDVILLTATPENIEQELFKMASVTTYDFRNDKNIDRLKDREVKEYNHKSEVKAILSEFKRLNKLGVNKLTIFADKITTCNELVKMCYELNIEAVAIWSLNNNSEYNMTTQQMKARESVVKYGKIPDNVDVLIFNSSLETGVNIHDNRVVWHISHTTNETSQIQSRGRNRKDLACHYRKTKKKLNKISSLDNKWLNRPLTKEDKKLLANELNIVNEKGRLKKWSSISKDLKQIGYKIKDSKITINGKRVNIHIITK